MLITYKSVYIFTLMDDEGVYSLGLLGCYSSFILFKRLNWGVAIADYILYYIIYNVCECVRVVFLLWIFLAHDIFFSSLTETFFSHVRRVGYSFQPKNKISCLIHILYIYTYKSIHRFRFGLSWCYSLVTVLFFSDVCEIITWRGK